MAATFKPDLSDDISKVRYHVGDVGDGAGAFTSPAEVQDETISAILAAPNTILRTAATVARGIAAKYARLADVNVDNQLTRISHLYSQYTSLAERLEGLADAEAADGTADTAVYGGPIVMGIGDTRGPLDNWDCATYPPVGPWNV